MGPAYGPSTDRVLAVLSFPVWLAGGRLVAAAAVMGINRHQRLAIAIALEAVANLGLSVLLIKPLGLVGVALGMAIPTTIVNLVFMPRYLERHLRIPSLQFVTHVWVLPSAACAAFGVATYAVERWMGADSLLTFFLQVAVLLPLVFVGAVLFVVPPIERERLAARVKPLVAVLVHLFTARVGGTSASEPPAED
jgi:peptidoglycan biosynthesis protein MviN/MurJ (putative lipid II flippase)